MGYVMEREQVNARSAHLEAKWARKEAVVEYFQRGHGKTVSAEATLNKDASGGCEDEACDDLASSPGPGRTGDRSGCSRWRSTPGDG